MGGVVLAVGALLLAAGGFEMFVGNGDILSERGWSAFIAGAVLLAGGVVTMALGMAVRAVDRLRVAILRERPAVTTQFAPSPEATAPVSAAASQPDLFDEPAFEPAPTAPVLAAAPIEHEAHPAIAAPAPTHAASLEPAGAEPRHDDWLDHSFAELEREMGGRRDPAEVAPVRPEPVTLAAAPAPVTPLEPLPEPSHELHPARAAAEQPSTGTAVHEAAAPQAAEPEQAPHATAADQATVSAREAPAPATSAVIGRYESEGTSYVMYADGSIDAQSEAGVYRFASMAELKTFIES